MTLPDDTIRVELVAVRPCPNSTPCQTFTSHFQAMFPLCDGCNGDETRTVPTGIAVEQGYAAINVRLPSGEVVFLERETVWREGDPVTHLVCPICGEQVQVLYPVRDEDGQVVEMCEDCEEDAREVTP